MSNLNTKYCCTDALLNFAVSFKFVNFQSAVSDMNIISPSFSVAPNYTINPQRPRHSLKVMCAR